MTGKEHRIRITIYVTPKVHEFINNERGICPISTYTGELLEAYREAVQMDEQNSEVNENQEKCIA